MKKFRFRLERMLQIKEHLEKERQKEMGLATQKVFNQEDYLHSLDQNRQDTQQLLRQSLTGRLSTFQLLNYSRYFIKIKKNELTGREVLKVYQRDQEKKRLELLEATKQKKIYEKLKERKREKHLKEMDLLSQKDQDELATRMFIYNNKSSREHRELLDDTL
jgi:flagellar protein FliJ